MTPGALRSIGTDGARRASLEDPIQLRLVAAAPRSSATEQEPEPSPAGYDSRPSHAKNVPSVARWGALMYSKFRPRSLISQNSLLTTLSSASRTDFKRALGSFAMSSAMRRAFALSPVAR